MSKLETPQAIGFWGNRRVEYLKDEKPEFYMELQNSGKLMGHLRNIEEKAEAAYQMAYQKLLHIMEGSSDWPNKSEKEKEGYRKIIRECALEDVCNEWIWV